MIVGAQKSGTTSLFNYLAAHPLVVGHALAEHSFFIDDAEYSKGFEENYTQNFNYKKTADKNRLVIAKNAMLSINEKGLKRCYEHNPDCKIVLLMREPINRAYSAFTMAVKDGWIKQGQEDIMFHLNSNNKEQNRNRNFIKDGFYAEQINLVLKYFPPNQIYLLLFEDLKDHSQEVCKDLFNWMGLDSAFVPKIEKVHNVTTQPKSAKLAGWINSIRLRDNVVKTMLKKVLPKSSYSKVGNMIVNINLSDKKFPKLPEEGKLILADYYKEDLQSLKELVTSGKLGGAFHTYNNDNWIGKI